MYSIHFSSHVDQNNSNRIQDQLHCISTGRFAKQPKFNQVRKSIYQQLGDFVTFTLRTACSQNTQIDTLMQLRTFFFNQSSKAIQAIIYLLYNILSIQPIRQNAVCSIRTLCSSIYQNLIFETKIFLSKVKLNLCATRTGGLSLIIFMFKTHFFLFFVF